MRYYNNDKFHLSKSGDYLTVSKRLIKGSAWQKTMNPVCMVDHLRKNSEKRDEEVLGLKINDRKGTHTCQEARKA